MKSRIAFKIVILLIVSACGQSNLPNKSTATTKKVFYSVEQCDLNFIKQCDEIEFSCWDNWQTYCDDFDAGLPIFWPR